MNLKIQLSGFFEKFWHTYPDIQGLAVFINAKSGADAENNNISDEPRINYSPDLLKEIENGVDNVTKISKIRDQRIATMFDFFFSLFFYNYLLPT